MRASIQKWGNSHAIRIPKGILETSGLAENDDVEIESEADLITIRRRRAPHLSLAERIEQFESAAGLMPLVADAVSLSHAKAAEPGEGEYALSSRSEHHAGQETHAGAPITALDLHPDPGQKMKARTHRRSGGRSNEWNTGAPVGKEVE